MLLLKKQRRKNCKVKNILKFLIVNLVIIQFSIFRRNMEVRGILRNNTLTSLNRKSLSKNNLKTIKQKHEEDKETPKLQVSPYRKHPAFGYLRGTNPAHNDYKKFVTLLYKGLFYSVNNLKGPSQEYIKKKGVKLPEPADSKKKFLVLDLDQTLIHSIFDKDEKTDVTHYHKGDEFKFNVRPYCFEFLANMSQHYNVYVFTAGTLDYAEPIINYLNTPKKTILGFLHRKNCMETQNGFFIKDLRIIQNRGLKDIIMVDNLVHSFGLQITNGIPILEFLNNKNDRELQGLQKTLIELSTKDDVRQHLQEKLKLKNVLDISESEFLGVDEYAVQKI